MRRFYRATIGNWRIVVAWIVAVLVSLLALVVLSTYQEKNRALELLDRKLQFDSQETERAERQLDAVKNLLEEQAAKQAAADIEAGITKELIQNLTNAVTPGADGATGLQGTPGPRGATGATGPRGAAGTNGTNGADAPVTTNQGKAPPK